MNINIKFDCSRLNRMMEEDPGSRAFGNSPQWRCPWYWRGSGPAKAAADVVVECWSSRKLRTGPGKTHEQAQRLMASTGSTHAAHRRRNNFGWFIAGRGNSGPCQAAVVVIIHWLILSTYAQTLSAADATLQNESGSKFFYYYQLILFIIILIWYDAMLENILPTFHFLIWLQINSISWEILILQEVPWILHKKYI